MPRVVRLAHFPFQAQPSQEAITSAYEVLLQHLHPDSRQTGLNPIQQSDIFRLAGGFGWDYIIQVDDVMMVELADRVDELLKEPLKGQP